MCVCQGYSYLTNMIYDQLYQGDWYIPGQDKMVHGSLSYDPTNGPKLDVVGDFGWNVGLINLVVGKTTDGFVTLLDVRRGGGKYWNETNTSSAQYYPGFIFHGYKFEKVEELVFDNVSFSLFNLIEWFNIDSLQEDDFGNLFQYKPPKDIELACYEGCSARIEFYLFRDYSGGQFKTILKQSCKITLSYKSFRSFKEILRDIMVFFRFLSVCTYEQSYPLWIMLGNSNITMPDPNMPGLRQIPKEIRLIYHNSFYNKNHKVRRSVEHLIPYESIANSFEAIIREWFKISEELDPMLRLLVNPFLDKYDFSVEKFMDTMRAAETFHRRHHTNAVLSKEEFKRRLEQLCAVDLTDEERKWVREKLNFANEPTLKQRLAEMVTLYSFPYFQERVQEVDRFVKEVGDSRNYYTHFNPELEKKALKGKDLFDAMENVKLLLLAGVLGRIGIKSEVFDQAIRRLIY